jgi:nitrile hydratase
VCTFAAYWVLQHASVQPLGEQFIWTSWKPSDGGSVVPPVGFAASAGLGTLLGMRHALELMHPVDYLRMSYYERWLARLEAQVVRYGFASKDEMDTGKPATGSEKATPPFTEATSSRWMSSGIASSHDPAVRPLFRVGQRVRARNMHPTGHTRLPRYARGKVGVVTRDHGVYIFPDTNAHFQGEKRQHVYSVRFTARELWGEQAKPKDTVVVDLWDDYLETV